MSALAHKLPYTARQPHLQLVPAPIARPSIDSSIYRRRRVVAGLLVVALFLAVAPVATAGLNWAWHQVQPSTPVAIPAAASSATPQATSWTVRPGDTLWGIARAVKPQGDVRPLLSQLTKLYKDRPLQVGETIAIPG